MRNSTKLNSLPRYQRDSRYYRILEEISLGDITVGFLLSGTSKRLMGRIAFQRARERYLNRLAVERLESCGLVSRKARKGKQVFRITPKGKRILHEVTGESKRLLLYPERWDGKWRIVAYDLPEDKRSLRNSLRYVLEKCGFLQAQKSVWVFPYDAPLLERLLSEQPDIASHTFFLRTERFSQDQAYRKHFKLK